jgi:hypothetical protein
VWNQHQVNGLVDLKFKQSTVDECIIYRATTVLLIYVDDGIMCSPSAKEIQTVIDELLDAYLGIKISRPTPHTIELKQPHLIQQILDDMGIN